MSRRTEAQNNLMWSRLTDLANTVPWHVDGKEQLISPNDWKEIMTAGLRKTQRIAAGVDGGFVVLGQRTSRMKISEMQELLDFVMFFGDSHQVNWTIPTDEL
jgi:hypothetical protein